MRGRTVLLVLPAAACIEGICDWRIVDGSGIKPKQFRKKYLEKAPVVFTNLISNWSAVLERRWTAKALLASFGGQSFDSSHVSGNSRKGAWVDGASLRDFLTAPTYRGYSWFIEPHAEIVRQMWARGDFAVPEILRSVTKEGPFLSLSRKSQQNPLHSHENSWFAQVSGEKRWFVLPRDAAGTPDMDVSNLCAEASVAKLQKCHLGVGDVLYLPSGTVHGTCALKDLNVGLAFIGSPRFLKSDDHLERIVDAKVGGQPIQMYNGHDAPLVSEMIFAAASADNEGLLKELISRRADLHQIDSRGAMPISAAVEAGSTKVVKHLSRMVDLKAPIRGQTLLHIAAAEGHLGMTEYLISRGLDPAAEDESPSRNSPALLAAWHGHVPILKLLVARGVDIRQSNAEGLGPWHYASLEMYFYVIDYLHGLLDLDLGEFLAWSLRVNAPVAVTEFLKRRLNERPRSRRRKRRNVKGEL